MAQIPEDKFLLVSQYYEYYCDFCLANSFFVQSSYTEFLRELKSFIKRSLGLSTNFHKHLKKYPSGVGLRYFKLSHSKVKTFEKSIQGLLWSIGILSNINLFYKQHDGSIEIFFDTTKQNTLLCKAYSPQIEFEIPLSTTCYSLEIQQLLPNQFLETNPYGT